MALDTATIPHQSVQVAAGEAAPPVAPPGRVLFGPRALVTALLTLLGALLSFTVQPDFDYWWHLASGRYLAANHALPVPDPFSFTEQGRVWTSHEWLSELGMYGSYRAFGLAGPALLASLCAALIILLSLCTLRRLGVRLLPATFWTAVMVVELLSWFGPRPEIGALALFAATIWTQERWLARRDGSIWLLPVLFCLWANIHGSFVVGLAAPALLLAGESLAAWLRWEGAARLTAAERRRLLLVLASAPLSLCLNPNGPRLLLYPFTKLNNPLLKYLNHWQGRGLDDPVMQLFALLAFGYAALVMLRRPRLPLADLLMAGAFTAGGFWSLRFVPFGSILFVGLIGRVLTLPNNAGLSAPSLLRRLAVWRESRGRRFGQPAPRIQALSALGLALVLAGSARTVRPFDPEKHAGATLPVAAVNALGAEGLPGPLFHDYNWGGYLIWRLWPQRQVFIDGRGDDLYMHDDVMRQFFNVIYLADGGDAVLDRYGIRTVLTGRDTPLARYLVGGGRWRTTYDDGSVVRLERADP